MTGQAARRVHCYLAFAAISFLLVSCVSPRAPSHKATEVTVEQLRSSPDRFDGARVLVRGFVLQPMVGDITLHQTEPDYHHYQRETGTGIRLELTGQKRNLMALQLKRCVVGGTFHVSHAPVVNSWLGEITRLELCEGVGPNY